MSDCTTRLRLFREHLQRLTGNNNHVRPFVCDGDPYNCSAFVVGINPTSPMPFWWFWNDETGFDKKDWFRCYKAERKAGSLNAESSRRPAVSNIRVRIEWLVAAALPVKVMETNLYATPTRRASSLPVNNRDAWMFEFLLSEISPRTILLHGKEARKLFEQWFGCSPGEEFSVLNVKGRSVHIAAVPRLFDAPRQQAERFGLEIRSRCA